MRKKKIPVEELIEKSWNWWENADECMKEEIVLKRYMSSHNIKDSEVDW